jgi:hypothetical protein
MAGSKWLYPLIGLELAGLLAAAPFVFGPVRVYTAQVCMLLFRFLPIPQQYILIAIGGLSAWYALYALMLMRRHPLLAIAMFYALGLVLAAIVVTLFPNGISGRR